MKHYQNNITPDVLEVKVDEDVISPPEPPTPEIRESGFSILAQAPKKITLALFALVLLTGSAAAYFYRELSNLQKNPQIQAQKETADLIAEVSQIFLLPTGETPTIATVLDPAALKDQPFFVHAQKNDKVLIYGNAREAILYDPALNKVINVAPLVIGNSQANNGSGLGNPPAASPSAQTPLPTDNTSSSKSQK